MPPFPRPAFEYRYRVATQLRALRRWRDEQPGRAVPPRGPDRLLLATWNVANLGLQQRTDDDYRLIAELVSWFDVVALQEVADELGGLQAVRAHLPASYAVLFSDPGGNRERAAFVYDARRVRLCELVGEVAVPPADVRHIRLPGAPRALCRL